MFITNYMQLQHAGTVIASNLPVQLDTVNLDWVMNVGGQIPTDSYDCYTCGWTTPLPGREDYLIDQATNTYYSIFGNVAVYPNHLEMRITKYAGVVP